MKKVVFYSMLIIFLMNHSLHATGLPVVDVANTVQRQLLDAMKWVNMAKQWEDEYKRWKNQYKAIRDVRLDGSLLDKIAEVNTILKNNNLDFSDLDLENPKSQMGVYAKSLLRNFNLFDDCTKMGIAQTRICKNEMIRSLQEVSAVKSISENANELIEKLNSLTLQLKNAEDDKETQDITAGLQSTTASLNALKMQYEMLELRNKASKRIDLRQAKQLRMERFKNSEAFYKKTIF